jgi:phosphoribosyl 1,2-cyclic phosphate phosphodiesterase
LLHGGGTSIGFRIGPFAYLTDCHAIPEETAVNLSGLEILVIDALRFTPHDTHFNIPQAIQAAQRIGARRTLLTHLGHEVDHDRHARDLPAGVEFAFDGLRFSFFIPGVHDRS